MRVYEELEKEADRQEQEQKSQLSDIHQLTFQMKQDLGPSTNLSDNHHPMYNEIETFEKEVKKRLLVKLLSDG